MVTTTTTTITTTITGPDLETPNDGTRCADCGCELDDDMNCDCDGCRLVTWVCQGCGRSIEVRLGDLWLGHIQSCGQC
jgi:hypothetical protein